MRRAFTIIELVIVMASSERNEAVNHHLSVYRLTEIL